ncbi:MAG: tyrosine-type recombinase/integrase [Planctomycetes bacterium]|nr:tyrosine-type recombinase/integrase [Planctomycetota bacterium]
MSFYTWADTEGILSSPNPMIGVKAPKLPKGIIKIYTTNEIEAMLNEVEDVITYTAISVLWKTGIRGAELLKINRKDIDTAQQTIHIHGKGAKDRLVPYDSYCATLFELRLTNLQRSDQIFPTTIPQIRKSLRYICKLSNVPYRAPHCFRHTFACNYLKAGGSPLDLMYILGHSTLAMVNHYSQWLASDRACDNYHKLFATV